LHSNQYKRRFDFITDFSTRRFLMPDIELCAYQPNDLHSVLTFVGDCLHATHFCTWHPGDIIHWMSNQHGGSELEKSFWLYKEGDQILALAHLPPAKWNEFALIVEPQSSEDLVMALLQECQTYMQQRMQLEKPEKTSLKMSVRVDDKKLVHCLTSFGFQAGEPDGTVDIRSLLEPIPASILPEGFSIRSVAGEHEAALIAEAHNGSFGSDWTPEEYPKVMQTLGFDPARELVVVAPNGRFASFLVYWLDPISKSGLFEPVGCHKDFQRQGLTKALMYEAMRRMVAAGMETALVGHDIDNVAAVKLYASVGFKTHCEFLEYSKNLSL
jgi:mycothiol synthase